MNMKIGDLVSWNMMPTPNTPGAPSSDYPTVGTVLGDRFSSSPHHGYMDRQDPWCEVLWPTGEITKCFKKDLSIIEEN